jgi:hypothetical protein
MEIMPRPRWPHLLREVSRHGTVRWVVRVGHGPRTPITAVYGSPEFEAQYHAAIHGEAAPSPRKPGAGTLQWLWDRYRDSSAWAQLSMATRRQRENIMAGVLRKASAMPISELTRKAIVGGREDRKATPAQANNFIKLMRGLCKWAADAEHIASDPARDVGMLKVKTAGFPFWTGGRHREVRSSVAYRNARACRLRRASLYRIAPRRCRQAWTSACPRWSVPDQDGEDRGRGHSAIVAAS